jgi:2-furoyl-CoA dehydrogenase 2Fe-2S iron sulfur subunit
MHHSRYDGKRATVPFCSAVQIDGVPARSCLALAVQVEGAEIRTVEGLAPARDCLFVLQDAFREHYGLQCGFCAPGVLMSFDALLRERPDPSEGEIREFLSGHLCRCTGYGSIVRAAIAAARIMREEQHA